MPLPAATALPPAGCVSWDGGCGCFCRGCCGCCVLLLPAAASGGGGVPAALLGREPACGAAGCCSAGVDAVAPAAGCVGATEAAAGSGDGEAELRPPLDDEATLLLLPAVGDVLLLPPLPLPSALPAALAAAPALEPAAPAVGAS